MSAFLSHSWRILTGLVGFGIALCALIILIRHITSPLNPYYMKPTTLFTTLAIVIVAMIALAACSNIDKRTSTDYSVIRDLTDSTTVMPDEDALVVDLGIDANIWNGIDFTFFNVSDVSYTPHRRISLTTGGDRLASSEFTRKREVTAFKAKLMALLDSARRDTAGREHSSIYLPMAGELTRLAASNADRKVLVVFSDLMENTPDLSFYNSRTFAQLLTDQETISNQLSFKANLPDLAGVEIHFIYEPKNAKDDATYRRTSSFFKTLFESKGAKVSISANLLSQ